MGKVGVYGLGVLRNESGGGECRCLLAEVHHRYLVKVLDKFAHPIGIKCVHVHLFGLPHKGPYHVPTLIGGAKAPVGDVFMYFCGGLLPGDVAAYLQQLQQRGKVGLLIAGSDQSVSVMHQLAALGGEGELGLEHSVLSDVHQGVYGKCMHVLILLKNCFVIFKSNKKGEPDHGSALVGNEWLWARTPT